MREDQNCYTDQRCDYPERSHGAFSHRLTPLARVYFFRVGRRPPVDAINMRRVGRSAGLIIRSERMGTKHPFIGTVCEEAVGSPSNRGGTMTTLMDTVRIEAPKRSPVRPASPLDPSWDDGSEIQSSERSFRDLSRSTQWDRLAMGRGRHLWSEAA
jgi:hypothetical protein